METHLWEGGHERRKNWCQPLLLLVFAGKYGKRRKQKKERFSCCTSSAELWIKLCVWRFWLVEDVLVIHHQTGVWNPPVENFLDTCTRLWCYACFSG